MKILYLNSNSLRNKLNEVEIIINNIGNTSLLAIVVTETHLYENELKFINIPGFVGHHSCRDRTTGGGGVSIFVKSIYQSEIVYNTADYYDNLLVVGIPKIEIKIGGIYRSNFWRNEISNFFEKLENLLSNTSNVIIFFGDMNINLLNASESNVISYIDLINTHGYSMLNKISPNMFTRPASKTIIDHVLTDIFRYNYEFSILENDISDHSLIVLDINTNNTSSSNQHQQKFKVINGEEVKRVLIEGNFNGCSNYNQLGDFMKTTLEGATSEIMIRNKTRIIKPYIDHNILTKIREKNKLYRLSRRFPNSSIIKEEYIFKIKKFNCDRNNGKKETVLF